MAGCAVFVGVSVQASTDNDVDSDWLIGLLGFTHAELSSECLISVIFAADKKN